MSRRRSPRVDVFGAALRRAAIFGGGMRGWQPQAPSGPCPKCGDGTSGACAGCYGPDPDQAWDERGEKAVSS